MKKTWIVSVAVALLATAVLAGCTGGSANTPATAQTEVSVIRETVEQADPRGAADAILEAYEGRVLEELEQANLEELTGIDPEDTYGFVAYQSDPDYGLCDIIILTPTEDSRDQLREALYGYKQKRVDQFENYDILDSLKIAQNAIVLDRGDCLVLLMLPDNDAAREILDIYIPQ